MLLNTFATMVAAVGALRGVSHAPAAVDCRRPRESTVARALPNDNRVAAGSLRNGVLTLRLIVREADWYPESTTGCALRVHAFAEEGKSPRISGPLIRVDVGTDVRVNVRNTLAAPVWLRGLQDRASGTLDSTEVASGATRQFRFRATEPGSWYYWGGSESASIPISNADGQLSGALIVDPGTAADSGQRSRMADDRVFVLTRWTPNGRPGNETFQLNAINGRSWPYTERLEYAVGDSVRWHVINPSDELHMMHLHGFYYRVDSRGDASHDSTLARAAKYMGVTSALRRGEWISATWSPDRAGNWLFHCHLIAHMSAEQRLDRMSGDPAESAAHRVQLGSGSMTQRVANHATESMAGLLLGITVRPARPTTDSPPHAVRSTGLPVKTARAVNVFANTRPRVFGDEPGYAFIIQEGQRAPAPDSIRIPGSPLTLIRGEPVSITVHNRLEIPIGVHWHGIELESFYDGVGGWSGAGARLAPMIAPADSFVARFTPPRAGTFMYHVHSERSTELASGLYAPMIVTDSAAPFDPQKERIFVIGTGGPGKDPPAFINGSASPDTMEMVAGTAYRLRVIDISANEAHALSLRGTTGLAAWRVLARDGYDLPERQRGLQPARENVAAGVTRDFEFTPESPGMYSFNANSLVGGRPVPRLTTLPIRVRLP